MPHYTDGPKKGQRVTTNERTKALRAGPRPSKKKTATGTAAIGTAGGS